MNEQYPLLGVSSINNTQTTYLEDFILIEMNIEEDPTSILEDSLMLNVFSYLDVDDLGRISSVNKRWKSLSTDDDL